MAIAGAYSPAHSEAPARAHSCTGGAKRGRCLPPVAHSAQLQSLVELM